MKTTTATPKNKPRRLDRHDLETIRDRLSTYWGPRTWQLPLLRRDCERLLAEVERLREERGA